LFADSTKMTRYFLFFLFFICCQLSTANYQLFSAPPAPGIKYDSYPKDHVSKNVLEKRKRAAAENLKGAPLALTIGSSGTRKLAVILVEFPSSGLNTSGAYVMTQSDITGFNALFTSLASYYDDVSYGQLSLEVDFVTEEGITETLTGNETPFELPRTMAYYGADTEDSLAQLIKDALNAAGATASHSSSGGDYDAVMVAHAGYGNESTTQNGDIWSVFITWTVATQGFTEGTCVPAREAGGLSSLGVICHEFGHQLGLVDLYKTDGSNESIAGSWALMDSGAWNGGGAAPCHIMNFNKIWLGWMSSTELAGNQTGRETYKYEIPISTSVQIYKIPLLSAPDPDKEYFLLSYHKKENWDASLPGEGLLIWHIDELKMEEPDPPYVSRWEANTINNDSSRLSIVYEGTGNWTSSSGSFTDSESNLGTLSGITIYGFSGEGTDIMTFSLTSASSTAAASLVKLVSYPNPSPGAVTFHFVFSRPTSGLELRIFDVRGREIKKIDYSDISDYSIAQGLQPQDYRFTYEYKWDGKDEAGEEAGSGIYFYMLKFGSDKKTGKLAIVRP